MKNFLILCISLAFFGCSNEQNNDSDNNKSLITEYRDINLSGGTNRTYGSFISLKNGAQVKVEDVNNTNALDLDLGFYWSPSICLFDSFFNVNYYYDIKNIEKAPATIVQSDVTLTSGHFDNITEKNDDFLKNLIIKSNGGKFNVSSLPVIIAFQKVNDGKKGLIRVKSFKKNNENDVDIVVDIKVQN